MSTGTPPRSAPPVAVPRSSRSAPPVAAPRVFDVRAGRGGWEVVGEGGKPLSLHAVMIDAITLAVALAKRSGAAVFLLAAGGERRQLLQAR